jgi:hypothetical protein
MLSISMLPRSLLVSPNSLTGLCNQQFQFLFKVETCLRCTCKMLAAHGRVSCISLYIPSFFFSRSSWLRTMIVKILTFLWCWWGCLFTNYFLAFRDCLKAYHPICVEKNDNFLESEVPWSCSKLLILHLFIQCIVPRRCKPKNCFLRVNSCSCLVFLLLFEDLSRSHSLSIFIFLFSYHVYSLLWFIKTTWHQYLELP